MRAVLILTALLSLAGPPLLTPGRAQAEEALEPVTPKPVTPKPVIGAERDAAIDKAVRFLDASVMKLPKVHGTPRRPFVVATYGIVKLLHGDRDVKKIAAFLAEYVDDVETQLAGRGRVIQTNWPLAAAAIFFAELQARGRLESLALRTNRKIVTLLLDSQQGNGGWGHGRVRDNTEAKRADGYPSTLVATTSLVGLALGLVRRAHGSKPFGDAFEPALERAIEYFDEAQLVSGLFPYDPSQRSAGADKTGIPRSGGAIAALLALGTSIRTKEVRRAGDTVDEGLPYLSEGHGSATFGLWLSAQGMQLRGADAWARFKTATFRRIVEAQTDAGRFACICQGKAFGATNDDRPVGIRVVDKATQLYVTALTTWILLLDRTRLRTAPGPDNQPAPDETTPR